MATSESGSGVYPPNVRVCETSAEMDAALAAYVLEAARAAIATRGAFHIALSGGSLPKILGSALAHAHATGADAQYDKWHVWYVDERIVPLDHADSNHLACVQAIFSQPWCAVPNTHIHTINPDLAPAACAEDYEARIKSTAGVMDAILLGMGPDGHTASLFPGHPLLGEASHTCVHIEDSPKPPPRRITFTLPAINACSKVAFVATGGGKADVLAAVFDAHVPAEERLPSARVRADVWFTDTPAAAKLRK